MQLPHQPLKVLFPRHHWLLCWKPAFCAHHLWRNSSFYQEMQRSPCDYRDGGFPWTTRLHQILFQVRENCYRMLWNVEESFWGTKSQSSHWKGPGSPRPKKTWQVRSIIKSMLICFFDQKGIVHKEFVPPGQTVNAAFYVEVLKRLRENVRRKRPDQWRNNTWLSTMTMRQPMLPSWLDGFWPIITWLWCHILPTRPTLHPAAFILFPKLEMKLKGRRFQTEEIQAE